MNHDQSAKPATDKAPTEVACPANTSNAPDAKEQASSPKTIQVADPVVKYWQLQDKKDPSRNVWVSGVRGLCDTPEAAIALARSCRECLDGEWKIIQHNTEEEWQNEHRQRILH